MQPVTERKIVRPGIATNGRESANGSPKPVRWTVDDYYRMGDLGLFQGKKVELIRGEIIEMAPMKSPHATALQLVFEELLKIFVKGFAIRVQLPLGLSQDNEPEPDVAIVTGTIREYAKAHPKFATLVVEVSESTLRFDQTVKARLYAEYGIEEYWIVNLVEKRIEVNRKPAGDGKAGFYFAEQTIYRDGESVSPLVKPKAKIKVADILP